MSMKEKMTLFSMTLTISGIALLWYVTNWKVMLAILVIFWGQNLQQHVLNGWFDDWEKRDGR